MATRRRARARVGEIDPTGPLLDRVTELIENALPLDVLRPLPCVIDQTLSRRC